MFLLDILKITHNTDNENICDLCGEKFANYKDLIGHVRQVHHHPIMKCHECGKEFIHEKDRLHHVREEHLQKVDHRTHKWEHTKKVTNPQSDVDENMHNFGDNF